MPGFPRPRHLPQEAREAGASIAGTRTGNIAKLGGGHTAGSVGVPRDLTSRPIRNVLIGSRVSIREQSAQAWSKIQLEKSDILGRMKTIEQRLLRASSDFLAAREVDISEFDDRALKIINSGIFNIGDNNTFSNNAVGEHARVSVAALSQVAHTPVRGGAADNRTAAWDVGVVAILSEELRSVIDELKLERHKEPGGLYFYRGKHTTPEATVRIVATQSQSQSQGQRSAMAALENLRRHPRSFTCARQLEVIGRC